MSLSHDLGELSDDDRARRERHTAARAAIQELMRNGTAQPPESVVEALRSRRDGIQIGITQGETFENIAGHTNQADHITSTYTPLSGREEN